MIHWSYGNIFKTETEAIVNPVNCQGVAGAGLAREFKRLYPDNHEAYALRAKRGEIRPGVLYVHDCGTVEPRTNLYRWVINLPTKREWHSDSRLEDIEGGLSSLADIIEFLEIRSIAIPALGCGLGGLRWEDVKRAIERELGHLEGVFIQVFEPAD